MSVFAERLKKCREDKKRINPNFTQGFVADKVGVARTTYTAYENGTKTPPIETVSIIADLFGITTDFLLGRSDSPTPSPIDKDEEEFQAFTNNPSLQKWYKDLPKNKEEDLRLLRDMWETIKRNK
ncbi:helix-turn-helix domain-containing protein [Viridibacillus arvi]|uniref:helix-turn-helix domain-containing protein n=1 Tax=Viridibacillus arvi TaxID=263475 RepID=UPI0037F3CBF0